MIKLSTFYLFFICFGDLKMYIELSKIIWTLFFNLSLVCLYGRVKCQSSILFRTVNKFIKMRKKRVSHEMKPVTLKFTWYIQFWLLNIQNHDQTVIFPRFFCSFRLLSLIQFRILSLTLVKSQPKKKKKTQTKIQQIEYSEWNSTLAKFQ